MFSGSVVAICCRASYRIRNQFCNICVLLFALSVYLMLGLVRFIERYV